MYNNRTLSTAEALFVSRAQQKIAELGVTLAEQYSRNDVDDFNAQLAVELENAICTLKSTFLDWTEDQIQMMMDYYTIHGELVTYSFRSIVFNPLCAVIGAGNWATVEQLNTVEYNLNQYDAYLLTLINQLNIDYQAGDTILQQQINNIVNGNGALVAELVSDITIGGIRAGDTFPIGTTLESIWRALLGEPASVTNFTFDSYTPIIEVDQNLAITQFTWGITGVPQNLTISDNKGTMNSVAVTGTSHNISISYNWSVNEDITWTIAGDNIDPVTITVKRRYLTYYGSEATADDTPVTMTEAKVLAGTSSLQETADEVICPVSVATGSQGFIAVHASQSGVDYDKWYVDGTNFSDILAGEFILPPVSVTVNGSLYDVYRWGYRSPLTADLKLYR